MQELYKPTDPHNIYEIVSTIGIRNPNVCVETKSSGYSTASFTFVNPFINKPKEWWYSDGGNDLQQVPCSTRGYTEKIRVPYSKLHRLSLTPKASDYIIDPSLSA